MHIMLSKLHALESLSLLASAVILIAVTVSCPLPVQAQSGVVVWSRPVKLSQETATAPRPAVAADPWGGVHVFWPQGVDGEDPANLIYYTHWDGQAWSEPYDLFAGPDWMSYDYPYATCDEMGTIHLTWAGSDGLYYSSVPALDAGDTKSWQSPQVLVGASLVGQSRLVVDQKGIVHVVYSSRAAGSNVTCLRSEDQGLSWSEPVVVSKLLPGDPQSPGQVRLATDSHDGLHLAWSESHPPEWIGRHVFYARSNDGGTTWTRPLDLSDLSSTDDWDASINITVDSQDQIHVVWVCGASPGRCYRYSKDGGDSWSGIHRLFGELIGRSGWDAMAAGPYGDVYWVGSLRFPYGFYFSSLTNNRWRDPPRQLIDEPSWGLLSHAHFPQLAIRQGNQLHVVMVESDHIAVWYMRGQTSRPGLQPPPTPSPMALPTLSPTPTQPALTPQPTSSTPSARELGSLTSSSRGDSSLEPIIWGLVPVLILLLTAISAKSSYFRR